MTQCQNCGHEDPHNELFNDDVSDRMFCSHNRCICYNDTRRKIVNQCTNCGHEEPHTGPSGDINDACTHPGCDCGFDSRGFDPENALTRTYEISSQFALFGKAVVISNNSKIILAAIESALQLSPNETVTIRRVKYIKEDASN